MIEFSILKGFMVPIKPTKPIVIKRVDWSLPASSILSVKQMEPIEDFLAMQLVRAFLGTTLVFFKVVSQFILGSLSLFMQHCLQSWLQWSMLIWKCGSDCVRNATRS